MTWRATILLAGALAWCPAAATLGLAQNATSIQPGFNLFTVEQDVEIGRASAVEAETQLRLLNDAAVDVYLNRIIQRLAAVAPGARYPYHIKAVNAAEINAFALPGGPMYVHRGLISAAANEAELAGVLAHELSHVALRHGTHQASTAYLAQTGIGLLGGLLDRNGGHTADIVNAVGGLGLNVAFLKFSRTAEYDADQTGAEIMARAGYPPTAMADFFQKLRAEQGRDPSKLEQFFSDHPPAVEREARIRALAARLTTVRTAEIGGLATVQTTLGRMPAAPAQLAQRTSAPAPAPTTAVAQPAGAASVAPRIAAPSTRLALFRQPAGAFSLSYPENWRATAAASGLGVSIVPQGGVVQRSNGQQAMVTGVIVNHYAPFRQGGGGSLKKATDDLVEQVVRSNSYLRSRGAARAKRSRGSPGYAATLTGTSPVTGAAEQVTVITRSLSDGHVIYALGITPASGAAAFNPVFLRMVESLQVNEQAAHRGN